MAKITVPGTVEGEITLTTDEGKEVGLDLSAEQQTMDDSDFQRLVRELKRVAQGIITTTEETKIYQKIKAKAGGSRVGAWALIVGGLFVASRVLRRR